jgi:hypothetical protein
MNWSIPNIVFRIIELATLARVGLVASFVGLIVGQTRNSRLALVVVIVLVLLAIALLRSWVPKIDAEWSQVGISKRNPNPVMVQERDATVEFEFAIPSHHKELYMTFELEPYDMDITQRDPVNFDLEKGVTYHSPIDEVEVILDLEMKADLNSAGTVPLRIKDKLHGRTIAEIQISS